MLALPSIVSTHPCVYLPDREARMEYTLVWALSSAEYEAQMNRRFRKFGDQLFRPVCAGCDACQPLRVATATFTPNRSQRRCLARNADLTVRVGEPVVDTMHLDLYNRYHQAQEVRKDWHNSAKTLDDYAEFFQSPIPLLEVSVWDEANLIAVVLCDVTPHALSAVYHFHDFDQSDRGLGTFALLETLRIAGEMGKSYLYLGYYIAESRSMSYKSRFRPCEILTPTGWQPLSARD